MAEGPAQPGPDRNLRPDLSYPRAVHIVGIGGAGMSAIAGVLLTMGHRVSGSDAADSDRLRRLAAVGADVHVGHDPRWLGDAEVVAISTAIPASNVEVIEADRRGLRVWRRAELLSAICAQRRTIAVSGTHGKTSTSAMLAVILRQVGLRPSFIVGGDMVGLRSGAAWEPDGEWLVVEADESDGTFLDLGAEAVVITSVEPDHMDFYGDEGSLRQAFVRFAEAAPGQRVMCADDPGAMSVAARVGPVTTYGTSEQAMIRIEGLSLHQGGSTFTLAAGRTPLARVELGVPGVHNARNAAAAITMAQTLGVSWTEAGLAVGSYAGVARRFEPRGERDGITFVDDYGHLPGEVAPTLATAARGWDRVVAVFQPHRYSRTEALWPDFADAFGDADILLITDIYPAGEAPRPGVTGRLISDAVRAAHPAADVRYVPTLDEAACELRRILQPGDLCLTLGAGDVTTLPDRFVGRDRTPGGGADGPQAPPGPGSAGTGSGSAGTGPDG